MEALLNYPKMKVVRHQGSLNAANALEFERDLTTAIKGDGNKILLLDLDGVDSLDSAGLMALVSVLKLCQSIGGRMGLCSVSPAIRIIFELTQLDTVFEIFDSQADFEAACLAKTAVMLKAVV